jgi:hypothetical protein
MTLSRFRSRSAASLMEVVVATGLLIVGLGGNYAVIGRARTTLSSGNDAAIAQQNTMTRLDQLRSTAWVKVTDPTVIATMLNTPLANTTENLTSIREVVTVTPLSVPAVPAATISTEPLATTTVSGTPLFTVTRTGTTAAVISPATYSLEVLQDRRQLNYRVMTEWQSGGRILQRELSTIISKSGTR